MPSHNWVGKIAAAFERRQSRRNIVVLCVLLAVVTFAVYMQAGDHPFISFDDPSYVTDNPHVSSGISVQNIFWAFTSVEAGNWHPITWLSHMTDVQLYGMNPRWHHVTNVIIHIISSLLLLFLLHRCTGLLWQSSFVAFLFALHPLHVESVAWVAERKDVLSAFLWFVTLLFYSEYVKKHKPALYVLSLVSFMLGLMSKPMLVTLPVVMLLMDYWPFDRYRYGGREQGLRQFSGRLRALAIEKIPFFICSLLSGLITIYAQHKGGATSSLEALPLGLRVENASVAYVNYIIKTLWPSDLAVYYPFSPTIPFWHVIGSLLVLLLISAAVVRIRHRHPSLAMGWFWFLVTLIPVIGLLQVGSQSMADRYSYIPAIGLFIVAAWGAPLLTTCLKRQKAILAISAGLVIIASAVLTWQQLGYWRDSISLYRHALSVTSGSYLVHSNLGVALAEKGDIDAAIHEYHEAIVISPGDFKAHGNLGLALLERGDLDGAVQECQIALQLKPDNMSSHYNLGLALAKKGNLDGAIHEYQEAIRMNPNISKVHNSLGRAYIEKGYLDAATQEFQAALRISPNDTKVHNSLGLALAEKGNLGAAIREYEMAIRINPDNKEVHNNLGVALVKKGDLDAAVQEFQNVLRISPNDITALCNLGVAFAKKGDTDAAIRVFQNVLRINPGDTFARNNLERALAQKKMIR